MDNQNMVRILQNMIDEAEEGLDGLEARVKEQGYKIDLSQRRADLAEAVELVEELGQPAPAEQGEEREGRAFNLGSKKGVEYERARAERKGEEMRVALEKIDKAEQAEAYSSVAMTTADYIALVNALRNCGDMARAALATPAEGTT